MSISILYHILSISFVFEKGGERGYMWKCGERDRIRAETRFWRNVVNAISTSVSEDINMTYNELKRIITDEEKR